ncbi:MAG: tetratricopeptide repeat protein [Myxococcales bacterium]|nr:tetratricopeptide repeat protein [Myxococcales bacterium]
MKLRSKIRVRSLIPLFFGLLFSVACTTTKTVVKPPERRVVEVVRTAEDDYQEALTAHKDAKNNGGSSYQRAEKFYKEALEKKPSLSAARFNLAALYEDMGEYNRAARQLGQVLQQDEKNSQATYRLVQLYIRQNQNDVALRTFYRYLRLNPDKGKQAEMQINLASLQIANNQYEEALKTARGILALDPDNIQAYRIIARVYLQQKKYKIVHLVYQLAEKTKKKDARLFNIQGLAYLSEKKMPEAMYFFGEAAKLDPSLFSAQMNLGLLALRYHDYKRALDTLKKASTLRPRHEKALLGYALALRANRKFDEAEKVYKDKLLKFYKGNAASTFNLAVLYLRFMEKPEEAKALLRTYIGEQGSRISNTHVSYALLKEAEDRIKMKAEAKREAEANKKKQNQPRKAPPPRGNQPSVNQIPTDVPPGTKPDQEPPGTPAGKNAPADKNAPAPRS